MLGFIYRNQRHRKKEPTNGNNTNQKASYLQALQPGIAVQLLHPSNATHDQQPISGLQANTGLPRTFTKQLEKDRPMIITAPEAIYPIDRANAIAAELRTGEDDDWTYAVEEIEANPGMARISITDEDGVFVANFG